MILGHWGARTRWPTASKRVPQTRSSCSSANERLSLTDESAGNTTLRWRIPSPLGKGRDRVRGGVEGLRMDLVNGHETFPPHPGPRGEGASSAAISPIQG